MAQDHYRFEAQMWFPSQGWADHVMADAQVRQDQARTINQHKKKGKEPTIITSQAVGSAVLVRLRLSFGVEENGVQWAKTRADDALAWNWQNRAHMVNPPDVEDYGGSVRIEVTCHLCQHEQQDKGNCLTNRYLGNRLLTDGTEQYWHDDPNPKKQEWRNV